MDRHLRPLLPGLALLALVVAGGSAQAGERLGTDVFAGYSFARIDEVGRHGGDAWIGFDLVGPFAGFVDASAHWGQGTGLDRSDLTLMAGPGVRFGKRGGTVFFVRALAGVLRERASIGVLDVDISESTNRLGGMGGGGVERRIAKRWAACLTGDFLWNNAKDGGKKSGFRASAGIVRRFGIR